MNELQLQRFIDGELNDADQSEFLKKLESKHDTTAWRTLALGFVEDRLFRNALANALTDEGLARSASLVASHKQDNSQTKTKPFSAWSVLTLCIGIASGVLLMQSFSNQGFTSVAQITEKENETVPQHARESTGAEVITPNLSQIAAQDALAQQAPDTQIPKPAMHLEWKTNEDQAVTLPVYFPEQYAAANRLQQLRPFPKQLQKELESRGYKVQRKPRIYRLPLDDGRQILVPAESVQVRYAIY